MALNPISFTEKVVSSFLRYQLTAYRFADARLHAQMRELLSLEKTRATPLLKGPYVSVSRGFRPWRTLKELSAEGIVHPALEGLAPFPSVWAHQEAAIRSIRAGRTTVVSTGTGSGKTEAFLYPVVSRCLELRDAGAAPGIVAVLVYPMNALAEDQLGRLRDLLCGTGVSFGMYVGKTPERRADVSGVRLPNGASREEYRRRLAKLREEKRNEAVHPPEERCSREEMRAAGRAPRILLTNVKQLELLLTRQKDVELFAGARLEILVVDEAHTFSGANGAETACLLRRLRTFCGSAERETVCVATSATLADRGASDDPARTFASRFFGIAEESVTTVTEEYEEPPFDASRVVPAALPEPAKALPALLAAIEAADGAAVGKVLGGGAALAGEAWREALGEALARNELLFQLSDQLRRPALLPAVAEKVGEACGRPVAEEEVLAWLALGAAARRDGRPFVRPVVHDFVRGIDGAVVSFSEGSLPKLWLSARAEAAAEGEQELVRLPVLTCTTCGQHYFAHSVADLDANGAVPGGGEASEQGAFWRTLSAEAGGRRLLLTDRVISVDEEQDESEVEGPDLPKVFLCRHCGTLASAEGGACPACGRPGARVPLFLVRQKEEAPGYLSRCVSCGAVGRRRGGGYREPARSVRAVTVSDVHVLAQDMVRQLSQRRLLVFADSRQDAAFQAGWMRDHARRFRLRALMWEELSRGTKTVIDLTAALDRLMEADDELSQALLPEVWAETRKDAGFEHRERRKFFLRVQVLREVTAGLKQRIGLEPWGRLRVEYEGLSAGTPGLAELASRFGLDAEALAEGIGGLLDRTRRRMILLDKDKRIFSRFWRDGDPDVLRGFVPAFQGVPTGLKLQREAGDDKSRVSAWVNDQRNTAVLQVSRRWGVPKEHVADFVGGLWALLAERTRLLAPAVLTGSRGNALPGASGTFQIDADRLLLTPSRGLWRCSECRRAQVRRAPGDVCPSWHCHGTLSREDEPADDYDLSLLDGGVPMLRPREHSAQVPAGERERLERLFKDETTEAVNTLVATPTLEMGVDIGALDAILLRNVPPSPANYWQRAGRAGRRERMAVALTYAGLRGHDRSAFVEPLRLLAGSVTPPQFNLRNELMVARHVHAAALTRLHALAREGAAGEALASTLERVFPSEVKSWLFDAEGRVRREPFDLAGFRAEVSSRADDLADYVSSVFRNRWPEADAEVVGEERVARLVEEMPDRLEEVLKTLGKRLQWALDMMSRLDRERAGRGVLERDEESIHDRCKALVRKLKGESRRARGGTEGYDDANTFGVLAAEGFLPGYGLETGSIQGIPVFPRGGVGMEDFSLPRPPAVALREYVPGNLIYANGNRFVARLFHFEAEERPAYFLVDAEREAVEEVPAPGAAPAAGPVAPVAAVTAPLRAASVTDVELVHTS
ncbi:DEAD/DEAH box helicase, partial [Acidobacteria bacterium ACD]|nr:DEAD/DEAH box helicase [Acidobacteria bacterium ACD]